MPLSPEDVHNKQFTPTRFRLGYDEDEVDVFLDEVEAELTRLLSENTNLREQLAAGPSAGPGASVVPELEPPVVAAASAGEIRARVGVLPPGAQRRGYVSSELQRRRAALESEVAELRAFREHRSRPRTSVESRPPTAEPPQQLTSATVTEGGMDLAADDSADVAHGRGQPSADVESPSS